MLQTSAFWFTGITARAAYNGITFECGFIWYFPKLFLREAEEIMRHAKCARIGKCLTYFGTELSKIVPKLSKNY